MGSYAPNDWSPPEAWVRRVLTDLVPKMERSKVFLSVVTESDEAQVKFWVELGLAIMMDKPIIVVAFHDVPLSKKLRRVADEIVYVRDGIDPESSDELRAAILRVVERLK